MTARAVATELLDRALHAPLRVLGCLAAAGAVLLGIGRVLSSEDE